MSVTADTFRSFDVKIDEIELIGDRYLLEILEAEQVTASGIHLPGQDPENTGWQVGRVLAVGNGHRLENEQTIPMFFKVGDLVICERFSGRDLRLEGRKVVVMNQTSCFGRRKVQ